MNYSQIEKDFNSLTKKENKIITFFKDILGIRKRIYQHLIETMNEEKLKKNSFQELSALREKMITSNCFLPISKIETKCDRCFSLKKCRLITKFGTLSYGKKIPKKDCLNICDDCAEQMLADVSPQEMWETTAFALFSKKISEGK